MSEYPSFPLTQAQRRVWTAERTRPNTSSGQLAYLVQYPGEVDAKLLEQAILIALEKHEILRMRMLTQGVESLDDVRQYVAPAPGSLAERDFSGPGGDRELQVWAQRQAQTPAPRHDSPLAEFTLLYSADGGVGYLFRACFMVCDHLGASTLLREVDLTLQALTLRQPPPAPRSPSWREMAAAEAAYLESPDFTADQAFWQEKLQPPPAELNPAFTAEQPASIRGDSLRLALPDDVSAAMDRAQAAGAGSLFQQFTAAFTVYLHRVSGLDDFALGTVWHWPQSAGERPAVGCFFGESIFRFQVPEGVTFADWLRRVHAIREEVKPHIRYPFNHLGVELSERWQRSSFFLFNVCLLGGGWVKVPGARVERLHPGECFVPLNLVADIGWRPEDGPLVLDWQYQAEIYSEALVAAIHRSLVEILRDGLARPDTPIRQLNMMATADRDRVLGTFVQTKRPYFVETTMAAVFEETARRFPDRPAVVFGNQNLTYAALNRRANQLARRLTALGVGPEIIVGILLEPCLEMVTAILAVLKAGGAYMPIDAAYPADRVEYMLADAAAPVLLAQEALRDKVPFAGPVLALEDEPLFAGDEENLPPRGGPDSLAYIIYTSGTTGKPKGVMIENRSLVHLCRFQEEYARLTPDDRASKFAGFGFDASVIEIFPPLAVGASLHVVPGEIRLSPREVNAYFEAHGVTAAILPTQFAEQFMENCANRSLRYLEMGGDKLRAFQRQRYRVINAYGPTEYTVESTKFEVDRRYANIPIGPPMANTAVYILDPAGNLQPPGAPGELCVAGLGIARGYRNRPDLTEQKFVPDPFVPGRRMYRTGDLARWLPDGNLEFLGRIDQQVKIRGFRIELGEIEAQLLLIPGVLDAAVLAREEGGDKYLCAYLATSSPLTDDEIREILAKPLPAYMIPPVFVRLERLPLTPNGKVDRRALPAPVRETPSDANYVAPSTPTEERMATLWGEILGLKRVGAADNFFTLGGHSLKAVALQAKVEKAFGVQLPLHVIFEKPTPAELAAAVDAGGSSIYASLRPLPVASHYPATAAQKRLWALDQMGSAGLAYNLPMALRIDGPLDPARLATAFQALTERHEILRTAFETVAGEPVQVIHGDARIRQVCRPARESDIPAVLAEFIRPFDLTRSPLFRVELLRLAEDRHVLLLDLHHAVFDGLSFDVFVKELLALYAGRVLEPLALQYRDFAVWQRDGRAAGIFAPQEAYWLGRFAEAPPPLELPTDHPRTAVPDPAGKVAAYPLPPGLSSLLDQLAAETGATPFMLFLAAYAALLARYTSQTDLVIGIPASGRTCSALQGLVGMFVNSLPIRLAPRRDLAFQDFLAEVKRHVVEAYDNQDYQLDDLIDRLGIKREAGRNPLFETMFSLIDFIGGVSGAGLAVHPLDVAQNSAQFDFSLEVVKNEAGWLCKLEYRTALFLPATVDRIAGHFLNLLESLAEKPSCPLGELTVLSSEERRQLLETFNDTTMDVPTDRTVHALFTEQARRTPTKTALVDGDRRFTYAELDARSDALAARLQALGLGRDRVAGLLADRCAGAITAMLAVLKAGGAYVPIDPHYPAERIRTILDDSGACVLLSQTHLQPAQAWPGTWLDLDDPGLFAPGEPPPPAGDPTDLAYLIYTSGSTGKPKGVMIEHRGVVNLLTWHRAFHGLGPTDVCAAYASLSFDASVVEIYSPLLAGAELHLVPEALRLDLNGLNAYFEERGVTWTDLPTQLCEAFMETVDNHSLRRLSTGSEKLRKFTPRNYTLVDEYGPTEYTVDATAFVVDRPWPKSPIGKPVANTRLYILDPGGNLQPVGVPGELCIAGVQLARGYLNRPELTAEKFVPDPFVPGERMYRTGDLARWLPDGNVDFIGRRDFQVKIRGFRIELEEIEQRLRELPGVENAVVLARADAAGNACLAGYLQAAEALDLAEARKRLAAALPDYMVPASLTRLERFPLNVSGKVDRKALPEPEQVTDAAVVRVPPRNETEAKVAAAFAKVLNRAEIGAFDNFFDLGGHSLKAVALVAELQKNFEVGVNDVFTAQTVAALAERVKPIQDNIRRRLETLRRQAEPAEEAPAAVLAEGLATYRARVKAEAAWDLSSQASYPQVLLTGATGFLGAYLLRDLLDGTVEGLRPNRVHLPVRAETVEQAEKRLAESLAHYFGDGFFSARRDRCRLLPVRADGGAALGLPPADYAALAGQVDAVFHAAALVKHYGRREEFVESNVRFTENLLRFAADGQPKDFHLVSTISVGWGDVPGVERLLFTEYVGDVGQRSGNLYLETKLEAERLAVAARAQGLKTSIYRLGNITFDSATGRCQKNLADNGFFQQLRAYVNLGAVPDRFDAADFSFVDQTSRALLTLAARPALRDQTWHVLAPEATPLSRVLPVDGGRRVGLHRLNIRAVRFRHFVDLLLKCYGVPGYTDFVENLLLHQGWLESAPDGGTAPPLDCCERTRATLERLGFTWPALAPPRLREMVVAALAERCAFLRRVEAFADLPEEDLVDLAGLFRLERFQEDDALVWEGETLRHLLVIEAGVVEIAQRARGGWHGVLGVRGPGDLLGLVDLTHDAPTRAVATAVLGGVRALGLRLADLRELMLLRPKLTFCLLKALGRHIRDLETLLVNMG